MAKTLCKNCNAINPSNAPTCHNCGERIASGPSDATACSRIADPEGKHLEICRIQLARTVMERDQAREKIRLAANALKHHHMSRPGIAAIVQLLTENAEAIHGEKGATK